ncbi:MAG: hypothetical protein TREMPRED_002215 [Tremellales sp. Tagirdzhanova-0007]|nr:MAG: hypothetical protein TREMPRED_002215 [Tremellales sp. Tagirdzhanova-0007]
MSLMIERLELNDVSTLHQRQPSPNSRHPHLSLNSPPSSTHSVSDDRSHISPTSSQSYSSSARSAISPAATPLPYIKILPILIARCAEGLNFSVIFPYINAMMKSFGVPDNSVGIWSASAESALMITEAFTAPLYAPLADRIGRRPVIIVLEVLFGFLAISFGFVESAWSAVLVRACLGLLAGLGVLSRTMIGELCDRTNRIQGFALFSPALTVGVTIGPLIGGFLANPVPRLLSPSFTLFDRYPYLLPALVTGSTSVIAAVTATVFLPETLPSPLRRSRAEKHSEKTGRSGVGDLLRYPPFQNVLVLYGMTNSITYSWEAIYPLFAFTNTSLGGLQLSTQTIGVVLALSAVLSIFQTIFIYPVLHRAIPENLYLRLCLSAYPAAILFFPVIWALSNANNGRMSTTAWTALAVQMILRRVGDFATTMLDTVILDAIPGPEHLASANSITFSAAGIGRAIGPFIVSSAFSLSGTFASPFSFGRQLVWIVFAVMSMPPIYLAYRMQADTMVEHAKEDSSEERHELLGTRRSTDMPEDMSMWRGDRVSEE